MNKMNLIELNTKEINTINTTNRRNTMRKHSILKWQILIQLCQPMHMYTIIFQAIEALLIVTALLVILYGYVHHVTSKVVNKSVHYVS